MKQKYILSYGAGVDSTALAILLIKKDIPVDGLVFADTGGELPETYEYLETMADYVKQFGISFDVVHPHKMRYLYERCIKRKVIPSQLWRWCTRDVKVKPIHRFYKKNLKGYHITQYLGIDYGERGRAKKSKEDFIRNVYPLIHEKIDRNGCIDIIKNEGLPVPLKSGCYFCPFNNKARWGWLKFHHPLLFKKAMTLNKQNKYYPDQTLSKIPLEQIQPVKENDIVMYCGSGYV